MFEVVLPVLDEAAAIPAVLASLPPDCRAIVVDNGSTDDSAHIARDLGALVVAEPRRGFGAACFRGLCVAATDVVAFMDCDGTFDGGDLLTVVGPVERGESDLVLGRRAQATNWSWHSRVANRALAFELRRRFGLHLHDLGPMRAARRTALLDLGIADRRSGWPLEMVVRAAQADWRITEVPVGYAKRVGRSKVTGTIRGTTRAVGDMVRVLA